MQHSGLKGCKPGTQIKSVLDFYIKKAMVLINHDVARQWFKKAADKNDVKGLFHLGMSYMIDEFEILMILNKV